MLKKTWDLQIADHSRSLKLLAQLNQQVATLTSDQQWRLCFLNAWEAMYESHYAKSEALFQDIIQHSGNPNLADRAAAMLLSQYGITRRYTEAFELADRLATRLPQVTDAHVRFLVLLNLSQAMSLAGQTDLAVNYAHAAMASVPPGDSQCYPVSVVVVALLEGHRLKPDSPELQQALAACPSTSEPVYHTNLMLTLVDLYAHGGQPRKALFLLDQLKSSLDANGYVPNTIDALENRAWALAELGDNDAAIQVAKAVIAQVRSGDFGDYLKTAYEILYRIEKGRGNAAVALDYYEKYAALDKAYLDDVNARAMAYEIVQQRLLAQKLETEKLSEQNGALRLQQKLDGKTAEANRLYLALLLVALGFGTLWMFRLKRSQLRFKRLSHLDGLTAIYNRQHFMGEAERALQQLAKRRGSACLAFIDLDHFKRINDTHGHGIGDEVLRRSVDACRQYLRAADLFGRLGGEEFGILFVDSSREQGTVIAERVRVAIETTVLQEAGVVVAVSASIGLAFTDTAGHDLHRLCAEADASLYRAKRAGRNRVMVCGEGLAEA